MVVCLRLTSIISKVVECGTIKSSEALFRVFGVFLGTGNYRLATGAQHLPGSAATLRLSFVYARRFIVEIELVR